MIDREWELQLEHLRRELILLKESIRETSLDIIREGFSRYPVFIAHTDPVKIGEVILDKTDLATNWSISASTLEEFVSKGLVEEAKKAFFIEQYKDPKKFICLFVVSGVNARFVFIPYQSEAESK